METPDKDSGRYIVRCIPSMPRIPTARSAGDAASIEAFLRGIAHDPVVKLLDLIGPASQPHTVVVAMPHRKAASLGRLFRRCETQLSIEPDRPLSLFGED